MAAVSAPAPKVSKVAKKPKAPAAHPPFAKMIVEAIVGLKERSGSSRQAILKYIKTHYKVDEKVAEVQVRKGLVSATTAGKLVRVKGVGASGSFKVSQKAEKPAKKAVVKKAPKKKTTAAKPKKAAVAKKATGAKKPAAKKVKKAAPAKAKKAAAPKVKKAAAPKPKKVASKSLKPKKPAAKKTPKKAAVSKK